MAELQSVSEMEATAEIAQALANPVRLQILDLLRDQGAYVMHLTAMLNRPQANISQHLSVLRDAGLVMDEREGMTVIYRVRDSRVFDLIDRMKTLASETPKRRGFHRAESFASARGGRPCKCPRCAEK
jgi:DNA-binding transcriptional ArsR family regulator